ncbi:uncharacterized protein LOC132282676 [Cornus florida]|uniref:uncharacterized protein LOC132282676 n=1 Tax=Cornus florida TaxID=4283 RepID=UPI00289CF953|nr:uncharacterized protein LOC132282676 [Cornus florida]
MASRALTTTYSKLLSRMAVRSLRTFAPSDSLIQTMGSDLDMLGLKMWAVEEVDEVPLSAEDYSTNYYSHIDRYKMAETATTEELRRRNTATGGCRRNERTTYILFSRKTVLVG